MIDQAKQQIYRTHQIQQQQDGIHYLNVSAQQQSKIYDIFKSSSRQIRQIQSKLDYQFKRDFFVSDVLNKISSFRFVDNPTLTQYKPQQFQDLSIIPLVTDIVISHIENLLQIQLQIDPFTKQLIKMPDQNITVLQFVTNILKYPLVKQFDLIDRQYCSKKLFFSQRRDLWRPVLQEIYKKLSKVNFMISQANAMKIILNYKIKLPIREDDIITANDKAVEKYGQQNDFKSKQYEFFIAKLLMDEITKKRKLKVREPSRFFAIIGEPTNYEKMLEKSLENQKHLLRQNWKQVKDAKMYSDANQFRQMLRKSA